MDATIFRPGVFLAYVPKAEELAKMPPMGAKADAYSDDFFAAATVLTLNACLFLLKAHVITNAVAATIPLSLLITFAVIASKQTSLMGRERSGSDTALGGEERRSPPLSPEHKQGFNPIGG